MAGATARAPVAITARLKRSVLPPTVTLSADAKRAAPRNTSTPSSSRKRWAESCLLMRARIRRRRSMTAPKSALAAGGIAKPSVSAARRSPITREERIRHFDGTQPTFRQSPPIRWRSTRATLAPSPAAPAAVTSPAVPAPSTTRL